MGGGGVGADPTADDVAVRVRRARARLGEIVGHRRREVQRLEATGDPDDLLVAGTFRDFLLQADEVVRGGAALVVAAARTGDPIVGRMAVLDDDRDVVLVPWHAPVGQALVTDPQRLMVTEHDDGSVTLHPLAADDVALAARIRAQMRVAAVDDRMSDPLATLTREQGAVLQQVGAADGDVLLTGPPGSGKSAIVLVELARRLLSSATPARYRVLFVTGTPRLARRAEALTRLLGTASVTPVPQADVLSFLGVHDDPTPPAGSRDGDLGVPAAIATTFRAHRDRLARDVDVAHPLGPVPAGDVDTVVTVRARAATQPYADSATALAAALAREYGQIWPGERAERAAAHAAATLRPRRTPAALVDESLGTLPDAPRLSRPLRAAAVALARDLLTSPPHARPTWDLVVVDEFQRLPDVVLALLRRRAGTVLLSGDPLQSFAGDDAGAHLTRVTDVRLRTSLRLPTAVSSWIDDWWVAHGLPAPGIACAAGGGTVVVVDDASAVAEPDPATQVIAPASLAGRHDGWLDPAEAVGLEWPRVVLVDPEAMLAEHGPAGVFIAATRAIDALEVVRAA